MCPWLDMLTPKSRLCGCVYPKLWFHILDCSKRNLFFMENSGVVLEVITCIFRLSDKLLADYGIPIRSWDGLMLVHMIFHGGVNFSQSGLWRTEPLQGPLWYSFMKQLPIKHSLSQYLGLLLPLSNLFKTEEVYIYKINVDRKKKHLFFSCSHWTEFKKMIRKQILSWVQQTHSLLMHHHPF